LIQPIIDWAYNYLDSAGGIRREDLFLKEAASVVFPNVKQEKAQNFLSLIFSVSEKFNFLEENKELQKSWYLKDENKEKALQFLKYIEKEVKNFGHPLGDEKFAELIREASIKHNIISENVALSYLDISKKFGKNILGEFGLVNWPEINPRGVREKAHLIFKREKKPLHFVELANLINNVPQWPRKVHCQTIHNELIKDQRFVLVGRGTYALKEWGYEEGTVSDVIKNLLLKKGPLEASEVIRLVKEQRFIKENTILLNLQDKNLFCRLSDGRYILKKGGKKKYAIQGV